MPDLIRRIILLTFFLPLSFISSAQQTGRMETDRPDQTECADITKLHYFQFESGIGFSKQNGYSTLVFPTLLSKYGLTKNFEFRLITELNVVQTPILIPIGNEVNYSLLPVQFGGKLALCQEKGLRPKTSLLAHIGVPKLAGKKFQASKWAPSIILLSQHTITGSIGIGYNLGFEWDGESNDPYFVYTLATGFNIGEKWYSYIEIFGAARKNEPVQNTADAGIAYYINDNVKIDAAGGFGISKAALEYFFGIGFSFRLR